MQQTRNRINKQLERSTGKKMDIKENELILKIIMRLANISKGMVNKNDKKSNSYFQSVGK